MSLAENLTADAETRIWAVSYDQKRDAFRVALEDKSIFLLRRPIPEDDRSEVLEVYLEGDGEVFTVVQASGNEFSVPWDVIGKLAGSPDRPRDGAVGRRIGRRVRQLRQKRGLTQNQLAAMVGVKRPNISRLETGTHVPGIQLVERLAESLNTTIADLVA